MNSIYSKIAGLLIIFNVAVLGLFFSFDDYIPNEVAQKKEELQLKGNFLRKLLKKVPTVLMEGPKTSTFGSRKVSSARPKTAKNV